MARCKGWVRKGVRTHSNSPGPVQIYANSIQNTIVTNYFFLANDHGHLGRGKGDTCPLGSGCM